MDLGEHEVSLLVDVDNSGGCACVGAGSIWEIYVYSSQLCREP